MIKPEGKTMIMSQVQAALRLGLVDADHVERFKAAASSVATKDGARSEAYDLTTEDVCAMLSLSPWTVAALRNNGKLAFRRMNRKTIRYRRSDVQACIDLLHAEHAASEASDEEQDGDTNGEG